MKKSDPNSPDFVSYLTVEKFIQNEMEENLIKAGLNPEDYNLVGMAENIMGQVLYPAINEQTKVYGECWKNEKEEN